MIEVTATMLPSTVMNDRSLADQIASSAINADSKNLFIRRAEPAALLLLGVVDLDQIAVRHAAHGVVRTGNHLVAGLEPTHDLEVLVAGDAHFDRQEFGPVVAHHE